MRRSWRSRQWSNFGIFVPKCPITTFPSPPHPLGRTIPMRFLLLLRLVRWRGTAWHYSTMTRRNPQRGEKRRRRRRRRRRHTGEVMRSSPTRRFPIPSHKNSSSSLHRKGENTWTICGTCGASKKRKQNNHHEKKKKKNTTNVGTARGSAILLARQRTPLPCRQLHCVFPLPRRRRFRFMKIEFFPRFAGLADGTAILVYSRRVAWPVSPCRSSLNPSLPPASLPGCLFLLRPPPLRRVWSRKKHPHQVGPSPPFCHLFGVQRMPGKRGGGDSLHPCPYAFPFPSRRLPSSTRRRFPRVECCQYHYRWRRPHRCLLWHSLGAMR